MFDTYYVVDKCKPLHPIAIAIEKWLNEYQELFGIFAVWNT